MGGNEQTSKGLVLKREAEEALRKECEKKGLDYDEAQVALSNLYTLCTCTVELAAEAFKQVMDTIIESVTPAIHAFADSLNSLLNSEDLFFMVPPHVKHLAYKHPKARVRNKNWNRMWKIRERYMKCHKH